MPKLCSTALPNCHLTYIQCSCQTLLDKPRAILMICQLISCVQHICTCILEGSINGQWDKGTACGKTEWYIVLSFYKDRDWCADMLTEGFQWRWYPTVLKARKQINRSYKKGFNLYFNFSYSQNFNNGFVFFFCLLTEGSVSLPTTSKRSMGIYEINLGNLVTLIQIAVRQWIL